MNRRCSRRRWPTVRCWFPARRTEKRSGCFEPSQLGTGDKLSRDQGQKTNNQQPTSNNEHPTSNIEHGTLNIEGRIPHFLPRRSVSALLGGLLAPHPSPSPGGGGGGGGGSMHRTSNVEHRTLNPEWTTLGSLPWATDRRKTKRLGIKEWSFGLGPSFEL